MNMLQPEQRPCILVVDDEPIVAEVVVGTLAGRGYDVTGAGGGQEAINLAAEHRFDLVLLDVKMPQPDGWETLSALLKRDPGLAVVMVSGHTIEQEAVERGARADPDAVRDGQPAGDRRTVRSSRYRPSSGADREPRIGAP